MVIVAVLVFGLFGIGRLSGVQSTVAEKLVPSVMVIVRASFWQTMLLIVLIMS
jgi:hypothetical protein